MHWELGCEHKPHLVNEGGKLVVQSLDLLPLFFPYPLDCGIDLQVEGGQKTLVDSNFLNASRGTGSKARATKAPSNATSITKATASPATKGTPEATASTSTNGDPPGPSQVVEAVAPKARTNTTDPAQSPTVS